MEGMVISKQKYI